VLGEGKAPASTKAKLQRLFFEMDTTGALFDLRPPVQALIQKHHSSSPAERLAGTERQDVGESEAEAGSGGGGVQPYGTTLDNVNRLFLSTMPMSKA
jgi:hypothetical protein